MLQVHTHNLMNDDPDDLYDLLNTKNKSLVKYEVLSSLDPEIGLDVILSLTMMDMDPMLHEEMGVEDRMIEFSYTTKGVNQILSQPGVRLIKINKIQVRRSIHYVVDYILEV